MLDRTKVENETERMENGMGYFKLTVILNLKFFPRLRSSLRHWTDDFHVILVNCTRIRFLWRSRNDWIELNPSLWRLSKQSKIDCKQDGFSEVWFGSQWAWQKNFRSKGKTRNDHSRTSLCCVKSYPPCFEAEECLSLSK